MAKGILAIFVFFLVLVFFGSVFTVPQRAYSIHSEVHLAGKKRSHIEQIEFRIHSISSHVDGGCVGSLRVWERRRERHNDQFTKEYSTERDEVH